MINRASLAFLASLFPAVAFADCSPTHVLDSVGSSTAVKSSLDVSSNCYGYTGIVDGTGTLAFPNVAALADATANPTDTLFGSLNFGYNGTTWDRLRTVGTGILKTDMSSIAGTVTVTGGVAGLQAVGGPVASGGSNADNPIKTGCVFNTTQPTITTGQIVDDQCSARAGLIVATGVDTFNTTINASLPAGPNVVGKFGIDQTTPGTTNGVQVNAALPLGTNVVGKFGIDQTTPGTTNAVQSIPGTTGGPVPCYLAATASTNSTNCKNAPGQVYLYHVMNTTATIYYLRMYNLTTAPTCSSATGYVESIPIPTGATVGGVVVPQDLGEAFGTGIGFCVTGGSSNTDNTNAAVGVFIRILYK